MPGKVSLDPSTGRRLALATAVQCAAGVLGTVAGAAYDTELCGVYIPANATAGTLTIAGFKDSAGTAASLLITGQTTTDVVWTPHQPVLNVDAALVFTASIANLVWVFLRAYVGPERPNVRVNT
jgi:hypothetical protein